VTAAQGEDGVDALGRDRACGEAAALDGLAHRGEPNRESARGHDDYRATGLVDAIFHAIRVFFEHLAAVEWRPLAVALSIHVLKLVFRTRGWLTILAAAYPKQRVRWRGVLGAYVAGVGVNAITPARGGDLVKLYLVKRRIPGSSYATLSATLVVETLFDFVVATGLFVYALTLGILPGVPDLPNIPAFDWSFVIEHPRLAVFLGCVLLGGAIVLVAWASRRVNAFREKVARGFVILGDRRAFLTQVVSWQAASWLVRALGIYFFLRAFHIEAGVETVVAVLIVQGLSTLLPFTPGGAGTQQAVLVFALRGTATASAVLAFSVGMQLVTVAANVLLGFGAIAVMLRTLRIRRHLFAAREDLATAEPTAPPPRSALRG
jgi:uncharacterized membrane protein YbhN (UPF0104 family)